MNHRLTVFLWIGMLVLGVCSLFVGVSDVTPLQLLKADQNTWNIFFISRLPRMLALICAGAGLSISGLLMQNLTANKFVSPSTGATLTSAQLGILTALVWFENSTFLGRALFAFLFAFLGTMLFVLLLQILNLKDQLLIPLVGIMFSNIIGGLTSFIAYRYEMTQALSTWLVGHFSLVMKGRYEIVFLVMPLLVLAFVFANHFNIVGMGKNFSKNLGVPYHVILVLGLAISAMLSASVVVVVGTVSYVGLIVPNMIAMIKGDQMKHTLIDTALCGAIFVILCDMIARIVIAPYELPIELVIGILGSIIFVALLIYRLKHGNVSFKSLRKKKEITA